MLQQRSTKCEYKIYVGIAPSHTLLPRDVLFWLAVLKDGSRVLPRPVEVSYIYRAPDISIFSLGFYHCRFRKHDVQGGKGEAQC